MTIMEMLKQGNVQNLLIMGGLFILMVIMLFRIGSGVAARYQEKDAAASESVMQKKNNEAEVIAAIGAAVKKYRQK
ncbi:MAG: hypothetical protein FWC19_01690 [Treponema sp.]|nr:hypothetical protein [Treponema sp.]MCL2271504.1 hypothetical protein [Treponema sp.]